MAAEATSRAGYQVQRRPRSVSPVSVIGRLIESNAVGARCRSYAAGLVVCIELEIADEVARVFVKAREVLCRRLL
jgi:hypothetical protein